MAEPPGVDVVAPDLRVQESPEEARPSEALHLRVWMLTRRVVRGLFVHHAFDHAATMAFYVSPPKPG